MFCTVFTWTISTTCHGPAYKHLLSYFSIQYWGKLKNIWKIEGIFNDKAKVQIAAVLPTLQTLKALERFLAFCVSFETLLQSDSDHFLGEDQIKCSFLSRNTTPTDTPVLDKWTVKQFNNKSNLLTDSILRTSIYEPGKWDELCLTKNLCPTTMDH